MKQPYENFDAIEIRLIGGLNSSIADDLADKLRKITPNVRNGFFYRSGILNSWELVAGAVITVYVGKAFLDGFLQELGAQSAQGLTKALASIFRKAKSKNKRLMTAEDLEVSARELELAETLKREPNKAVIDALGRPIPVLSITLVVETELNPKFIFPYELDDVAFDQAISKLPDSIVEVLSRRNETALQTATSGIVQPFFCKIAKYPFSCLLFSSVTKRQIGLAGLPVI